jgi:hypothetical protein
MMFVDRWQQGHMLVVCIVVFTLNMNEALFVDILNSVIHLGLLVCLSLAN